jgi:hypothetical protein
MSAEMMFEEERGNYASKAMIQLTHSSYTFYRRFNSTIIGRHIQPHLLTLHEYTAEPPPQALTYLEPLGAPVTEIHGDCPTCSSLLRHRQQ